MIKSANSFFIVKLLEKSVDPDLTRVGLNQKASQPQINGQLGSARLGLCQAGSRAIKARQQSCKGRSCNSTLRLDGDKLGCSTGYSTSLHITGSDRSLTATRLRLVSALHHGTAIHGLGCLATVCHIGTEGLTEDPYRCQKGQKQGKAQ